MSKNYLNINVYEETKNRIKYIFDNFENIYLSFSGGKDSGVMMHLAMDECIKRNQKIGILFIDLEAQYKYTIDYIYIMIEKYKQYIDLYWICLPIILRNAVSVYEPRWICWDEDKKDIWVRELPKESISDINYFTFFRKGMEFEEFIFEFGKWYSKGQKTACMIGIRADESYNRLLKVRVKHNREFYNNKMWILKQKSTEMDIYSVHPIYDWKTRDIWIYNSKYKKEYNKLYDIMMQAGLSIHQQRICQPYGDDQRKGLWLFHIIEPDTWAKIVSRVNGANFGSEFVKYSGNISGQIKINKPQGHTWESFSKILLESMPAGMKEHYSNKIILFIDWYKKNGYTDENGLRHFNHIPDEANQFLESQKKAPSWRRIAKMLLRNDYWAKTIGFVQNKSGYFYTRYMERMKKYKQKRIDENLFKAGKINKNIIQRIKNNEF